MPNQSWFVYVEEEILGPLPTETVASMLSKNRLQFADYIWTNEQPTWMRIYEVEGFRKLLPPFPKMPIPIAGTHATETQPEPKSAPKIAATKPQKKKTPDEYHYLNSDPGSAVEKEHAKKEAFPKAQRNYRVGISATITIANRGTYKLGNISEGGVFVLASDGLAVGTDLKFTIESKSFHKPLEMTGVVIRQNVPGEAVGFAIEFTRVNPAYKRLLTEYVKNKEEIE